MSDIDEKILKKLDELQAGQRALQAEVKGLQEGQQALQAEVQKQGTQLEKQGQMLTQQGKLLAGLAANMATVLEEQQAQRTDIRSLHTEVHESREALKGEIIEARVEARADSLDLKAEVTKPIKEYGKRIHALEDATGIPHPDKN
jgi:hypothetical protein